MNSVTVTVRGRVYSLPRDAAEAIREYLDVEDMAAREEEEYAVDIGLGGG